MTTSDERCSVCGNLEADHGDRVHPHTPPGQRLDPAIFTRQRRQGPAPVEKLPFDPVLRQALLDKGIVTPEELKAAVEKVQAIMEGQIGGN